MNILVPVLVVVLLVLGLAVRIVKQYEQGVCSGWVGCLACANPGCG